MRTLHSYSQIIILSSLFLLNCGIFTPLDIRDDGYIGDINGKWISSQILGFPDPHKAVLCFDKNNEFTFSDVIDDSSWSFISYITGKGYWRNIGDTTCYYQKGDDIYRLKLLKIYISLQFHDSSYQPTWPAPMVGDHQIEDSLLLNLKSEKQIQILKTSDYPIPAGIYNQ
jgi:hypothetical protein